MIGTRNMNQCLSFISSQLQRNEPVMPTEKLPFRAVTISRQTGCGAQAVAERLAHYLEEHSRSAAVRWTVFDRDLMDKVLEDHNLPAYMARFLPEDRISQIEDFLSEIFSVHPPVRTIVMQVAETMLQLASVGHVILIGRGGNVVTARLPEVFHVRLVAPLEKRVEHAHEHYGMTKAEAHKFCTAEDTGRARYLKQHFNADINDPLLYHMIINTGRIGFDAAAKLIGKAIWDLN